MELVGAELRIQALFRELRLDDERVTPRFTAVWANAQSESIRPRRAFNFAFVVATALLVCALVSLAWWSRQSQRGTAALNVSSTPFVSPAPVTTSSSAIDPSTPDQNARTVAKQGSLKLAARHRALLAARRAEILNAVAISTWESPTKSLMNSPSDKVLTSLPQLNEAANELKSFLPNRY